MDINNNNIIRRGDIFIADLGECVDSVRRDIRPVLIIQNDIGNINLNTIVVIPFTSKLSKKDLPVHISISGDNLKGTGFAFDSMLLIEQIRVIDKSQLKNKIGVVNSFILDKVDLALSDYL